MKLAALICGAAWLLSTAALAEGENRGRHGGDTDVIVNMPESVWNQGNNNQQNQPCARCCTYGNQSFTEGAVIKKEGVLLQCSRDKASLGTNNLIWQIVRE